jgi:hypothetical protein
MVNNSQNEPKLWKTSLTPSLSVTWQCHNLVAPRWLRGDSDTESVPRSGERIQGESGKLWDVDEGRKRVIGVMAAILAARKLAQYDGGKRVPATVAAIADAVRWAEEIMREIDGRWPDAKAERRGA